MPLLQQSAVDFQKTLQQPTPQFVQAVIDLDSFWQLTDDSVANTVQAMTDLGSGVERP